MLTDAEINRTESELVENLLANPGYYFELEAISECPSELWGRWMLLLKESEALPFMECAKQIMRVHAVHIVRTQQLDEAIATRENELRDAYKYGHPDDERIVA